jgi:hypothetical protein
MKPLVYFTLPWRAGDDLLRSSRDARDVRNQDLQLGRAWRFACIVAAHA